MEEIKLNTNIKNNKINTLCLILLIINIIGCAFTNIYYCVYIYSNYYTSYNLLVKTISGILINPVYLLLIFFIIKKYNKGYILFIIYFFATVLSSLFNFGSNIINSIMYDYNIFDRSFIIDFIDFIILIGFYIMIGIFAVSGFNKKYKKTIAIIYFIYSLAYATLRLIGYLISTLSLVSSNETDSVSLYLTNNIIEIIFYGLEIIFNLALMLFIKYNNFKDFTNKDNITQRL